MNCLFLFLDFLSARLLPALVGLAWCLGSNSLSLCVALHLLLPDFHPSLFSALLPCFAGAYLAVAFYERVHGTHILLRPHIPENAFTLPSHLTGSLEII